MNVPSQTLKAITSRLTKAVGCLIERKRIKGQLDKKLGDAKKRYEESVKKARTHHEGQIAALGKVLGVSVSDAHEIIARERDEIFPGKSKTASIGGAKIAFKTLAPAVAVDPDQKEKDIAVSLYELGHEHLVKVEYKLDKPAIKEALQSDGDDGGLAAAGLSLKSVEQFVVAVEADASNKTTIEIEL